MKKIQFLNLPKIVLVGQTNVGKSSLFNRLAEKFLALTAPWPGVTKDSNQAIFSWQGQDFLIIDTPGTESKSPEIQKQIKRAIKEADLILNVIDGRKEISAQEKEFARLIKKSKKPILLVVNKVDSQPIEKSVQEKNPKKLGLGNYFLVSAMSGRGVGDLCQEILTKVKTSESNLYNTPIKIAIFGRTNVGKSSLLNKILAYPRAIVLPTAHTTREPQNSWFILKEKLFLIIDTAGMRRPAKIKSKIDYKGINWSKKVIERADILFLVLESQEKLHRQDKKLLGLMKKSEKQGLILLNKSDLWQGKSKAKKFRLYWQEALKKMPFEKIFISAKTGNNIDQILNFLESYTKK